MIESGVRHDRTLQIFTGLALAAFLPVLFSGLLSDDFTVIEFVLRKGHYPHEWPDRLPANVFRPLSMALLHAQGALWGTTALLFHAVSIAVHTVNAWLIYRIARALQVEHVWAAAAGIVFLASGAHTEAVAWISAQPDLFAAVFGLTALLALVEYRIGGRKSALGICCAAYLLALLCKESAATLILLLPVVELVLPSEHSAGRLRAVFAGTACAAALALYFLIRIRLTNSAFGSYAGYDTTVVHLQLFYRLFLWRAVVFPNDANGYLLVAGVDKVLAAAAAVLMLVRWREHRGRSLAILGALGLAITLLPVLPLTISERNSQSDRFVYLPSAFAACALAGLISMVPLRRAGQRAILAAVIAVNLGALTWWNSQWFAAGRFTAGLIASFAATVGGIPDLPKQQLLVNLPDTLNGIYIFRNGFPEALKLFAPEVYGRVNQDLSALAHYSVVRTTRQSRVTWQDARTVSVSVAPAKFFVTVPSTAWFDVEQTPSNITLRFTDVVDVAEIFYTSGNQIRSAGRVHGPGAPFGAVGLPKDNQVCDGHLPVNGWAMDTRDVVEVTIAARRTGSSESPRVLRAAVWVTQDRPDLRALFGQIGRTERATWTALVPCSSLEPFGGDVELVMSARDDEGHTTTIGRRVVRFPKS